MRQVLIDTDILSYFLRNQENIVSHFEKYLDEYERINFSIITYYEILSGLKFKDARKQLDAFLEFTEYSSILSITKSSVEISSDIYRDLREKGTLIDDIDILIAGIALSHNLVLVTHNTSHFKRINGLELEDWYYG
ncbi:type II toxin-antitoxin system VapC family toxin [candidate division KSB1 bacterium]|nr:type II toxin-antitoxin system VapC family toxin [candidate division KSB1 bacterium]